MTTSNEIGNMGAAERLIRGVVSVGLIEAVLLIPALSATVMPAVTLVALYLGLTAAMMWDPLYALGHRSTGYDEPVKAGISLYSSRPKVNTAHDYDKAA